MTIRSARVSWASALLAVAGFPALGAPADAAPSGNTASAAVVDQVSLAKDPTLKFVGNGENSGVTVARNPSSARSQWIFIASPTFPGSYFIRQRDPLGSGIDLYWDLSGNSPAENIPLVTARFDGTLSQRWKLESVFSGQYKFKNRFNGMYITFTENGGSASLRMFPSGSPFNSRPGL